VQFRTTPCPGCGVEVVIIHRPGRRTRRGRIGQKANDLTFIPKPGGRWKLNVAGVPYQAKNGQGDYAKHYCKAVPQAPGLRPTAGFRLD